MDTHTHTHTHTQPHMYGKCVAIIIELLMFHVARVDGVGKDGRMYSRPRNEARFERPMQQEREREFIFGAREGSLSVAVLS